MTDDDRTRLSRRTALRAAAALGVGLTAGCDSGTPAAAPATQSAGGSGTARPSAAVPAPSTTAGAVAPPAEVVNGPRDRPAVALTFHGQGDQAGAFRLIDELNAAGAKVTVLAVGTWLEQQPAIARRLLDGGHELGNHTQHHLAIASMAPAQAYVEINACATALKKLTGSIGRWFRPSQTQHSNAMLQAQAVRVGYPACLSYDLDSLDYTDPGAAAVTRNTLQSVQNGSIVSLHFGHAGTIEALPEILDGLRTRGLRPVTMTELMS